MTPDAFRAIALALPEAEEREHGGHPDFRVRNKVFASLGVPDDRYGMVKLTAEQQDLLCDAEPRIFSPIPGSWGKRGYTRVFLTVADAATVRSALAMAWRNLAPKSLWQAQSS